MQKKQFPRERKYFKSSDGMTEITAEVASLIKQDLNNGGRCGDVAVKHGVNYHAVYNILKEYAWKELEPVIINKHVARTYTAKKDKIKRDTSPILDMSPLLVAWGFAPKNK